MRALILVALSMLVAPWTVLAAPAAPVNEDVAWLADYAGVRVTDLPAFVPTTVTTIASGVLMDRIVEVSLADLAGELRDLSTPGVNAEAQFAGAGVVSPPDTRGVRWSGFVVGSTSNTPCMDVTAQQTIADPGLKRGNIMVGVHGETPGGRGSGVATMDVQLLPNPGPGAPVSTTSADGLLVVGSISKFCFTIFTIRITSASFGGDGIIYADGP